MPYSYAVYTGNGSTTQFGVPFPYIRRDHVGVTINYVATTAFTWVNDSTLQMNVAPGIGARVEIRRTTPVNAPLVDFVNGSTLVAEDLDTNALQQTYVNQEQDDKIQDAIIADNTGNLTAGGKRITNTADPVNPQDVATKNWVETAVTSPVAELRSIFYGAYSTDPLTDPYGNPPDTGDQYFNDATLKVRIWNGTSWQDLSSETAITRWKKTAAGGELAIGGVDDNGAPLNYTVGYEFVYLNGSLLARGVDYTATNGNLIAGLTALAASDVIEVISYSIYSVGPGTVNSIATTSPLASTGGATPTISIQDGTTTQKGAVQLEDSTSSTSTTTAATPGSVKSAYDLANSANTLATAAMPKSGGAFTGNVTLNAQADLRFADADSSNYVGLQAPGTVASNLIWTLPNADGSNGQMLVTNGSGVLSWATPSTGGMTLITTITPANSATSAVVTSIAAYKKLYIQVFQYFTLSTSSSIRISMSDNNGSTYPGTTWVFTNTNVSTVYGAMDIYRGNQSGTSKIMSFFVGQNYVGEETGVTGVINALRFTLSAGTFTGTGSLIVYGIN